MKEIVTRDMLHKGLRVIIGDEDIGVIKGTVVDCDDLHYVYVRYDLGGFGLYCFVEGCEVNSEKNGYPLYLIE